MLGYRSRIAIGLKANLARVPQGGQELLCESVAFIGSVPNEDQVTPSDADLTTRKHVKAVNLARFVQRRKPIDAVVVGDREDVHARVAVTLDQLASKRRVWVPPTRIAVSVILVRRRVHLKIAGQEP
jgi:hypothetical protein